ncbi:hypothetical protein [Ekhidna sp.]
MKSMITAFTILTVLSSCSSSKKYTDINAIGSQNTSYVFTLSRSSDDVRIVKKGPSVSATRDPSNREVFENSINQIAKDNNIKIEFSNAAINFHDDQVQVKSEIISAKWIFTATSATMLTEMKYTVNDKNYLITGMFKNWSGGEKAKILFKSITDANYKMLEQLAKNNNTIQ